MVKKVNSDKYFETEGVTHLDFSFYIFLWFTMIIQKYFRGNLTVLDNSVADIYRFLPLGVM
jgi:hypothetical protein